MSARKLLLEAQAIGKRFGGVRALHDVSLTINEGEIYGLIGPNGAGKTSFFNVLTGIYRADSGHFDFAGQRLDVSAPHRVAAAGIARTFQNIRLFANMTALENVMVGRHLRSRSGVLGAILRSATTRAEEGAIQRRAVELLHYVGIGDRANQLARHLPYGDQRRLEIARALATEPRLLALDEPAAGMNATETAALRALVQGLRDDGLTVLLIEHDVKLVMGLCDRVAVLDYGEKIAEDIPAAVQRNPKVIEAYLGGCVEKPVLEISQLEVHYGGIAAVQGISLTVGEGETVALIGANGAGKSSTLKALARLLPDAATKGSIRLCGEEIAALPTHRLIDKGLALVPEGRGVFARLTVAENLAMGAYSRRSRHDKAQIAGDLERIYAMLPRLKERERQYAGTLSGGEQQMLALGRALLGRPRLLLLDEPSMGLAPLMVQKIFEVIRAVAATGVSILLVEQNALLALETASRGYVMESGRITLADSAANLLADRRVREAYLGE